MTVLGSCIAVCMRDPITGFGGMNHFLLPSSRDKSSSALPGVQLRYGAYSIERLTNALVARGACRESIEVKVFGGANILKSGANMGHANSDFVESYLAKEKLRITGKSLRGDRARRLRYYPATGRAQVCETETKPGDSLVWRERQLATSLAASKLEAPAELFAPARRQSTLSAEI